VSFLAGAAVQRVDASTSVVLLRLRLPGETLWLVVAAGRGGGMGVVSARPWKSAGMPGAPVPEGHKMRLRSRLEGGRVVTMRPREVGIERGESGYLLAAPLAEHSPVDLVEVPAGGPPGTCPPREWFEAQGARLVAALGDDLLAACKQELGRALQKARARVARRMEAIRGDLERIGQADGLALLATLASPEVAKVPRGATQMVLTDWSRGEPRPVELRLDPSRSAREQVDALFKRSKRLKLGAVIAERRLAEAERAQLALEDVSGRVASADSLAAVVALAEEVRAAAPRDFALAQRGGAPPGPSPRDAPPSPPYRTFRAASGDRILVGRGAARNDALTFHVARPHDLWLHAKGRTGAHVVVPLEKNHDCPPDVLIDAAHLAAHFSDARGEGVVEVQHTPRRYLRKPRGAAPGLCVVDREKVTVLRVEPGRIERLLAAEEIG
jgi:hypothetical protein